MFFGYKRLPFANINSDIMKTSMGGVLLSTFLTRVVPVVYVLLARFTKVEVASSNGNEPVTAHVK